MPGLLPSSFKGSTESLAELPIKIQTPPLLPKVPALKVTAHNRAERWALDHRPCGCRVRRSLATEQHRLSHQTRSPC